MEEILQACSPSWRWKLNDAFVSVREAFLTKSHKAVGGGGWGLGGGYPIMKVFKNNKSTTKQPNQLHHHQFKDKPPHVSVDARGGGA